MKVQVRKDANGNIASVAQPWWPIGSIYLSVNNTNPSTYFGGTWEQIAKGKTLVGVDASDSDFSTAKKTGGEKKHKLTVNEIPPLDVNIRAQFGNNSANGYLSWSNTNGTDYSQYTLGKTNGGSQAHNNLQPYYTCYIWLRTA